MKQLTKFQESESALKLNIDATIAKAKETYKKYDSFLENCEFVIDFLQVFGFKTIELVDTVFESFIREGEIDFSLFQKKLWTAEVEEKCRVAVEKLSKSDFLKKKKLFPDIAKVVSIANKIDWKEMQQKFDRLLSNLIQSSSTKFHIPALKIVKTEDPYSLNSESLHVSDQKDPISKGGNKNSESFINQNLMMLAQSMQYTKNLIESSPGATLEPDIVRDLITKTNEFIHTIQTYFFSLKNCGSFIDEEIDANNEKTEPPASLIENLEKALSKISSIEQMEFEKLLELKIKNEKLRGIQVHIRRFGKQSDGRNKQTGEIYLPNRLRSDFLRMPHSFVRKKSKSKTGNAKTT